MLRRIGSFILGIASLGMLGLIVYLIVVGFPAPEWLSEFHLKSIRKPFQACILLFLFSILLHPQWIDKLKQLKSILSHRAAIWVLLVVYALLFLWHEIAEYYSIEINFIPFGFYDYMLYYFFHGKIHFTGLLHGFYHINNAMFLLAPFWIMLQSSFLLIIAHPLILVSAGIPLYALANRFFNRSHVPFLVVFVYLNYRYLQNVLDMNFSVESFYPLFFFSLIYFSAVKKWFWYAVFLLLSLSIKEDAFFYLSAVGFLMLFMGGKRIAGLLTLIISCGYFYWVQNYLVVWTGSDIFDAVSKNFSQYGSTPRKNRGKSADKGAKIQGEKNGRNINRLKAFIIVFHALGSPKNSRAISVT